MELNEYQKQAMTTCMPTSENFSYMFLNLVGEVGELASKVAKYIRKDKAVVVANKLVLVDVSEEEKEKLFDAIKANGYRWDAETKTLEKLPKFKDGDVLFVDCSDYEYDELYQYIFILKKTGFYRQWHAYCYLDNVDKFTSTETYLTDDKYHPRFATEEEKEKLFKAIKDNGYKWNEETKTLEELPKFKAGDRIRLKNGGSIIEVTSVNNDGSICVNGTSWTIKIKQQDNYELVPNKFDINTLVPFKSKVLARDGNLEKWVPAFWGFYNDSAINYPYECVGGAFTQCIPYEGNKHLLGKTDDCSEFYKTWE